MTTHRRSSVLVAIVAILLEGSALAGCSAGGGTTTGSSGSSPAVTDSPAGSSSPVTTGEGLCKLVSVAAANSAVEPASAFTDQEPGSFVNGEPECGFASDDRSIIVNVTVFDTATTPFDLQSGVVSANPLHAIAGVGDRAAVGSLELDAIVGSKGLVVENVGAGAVTAEQLTALAKLFASKL